MLLGKSYVCDLTPDSPPAFLPKLMDKPTVILGQRRRLPPYHSLRQTVNPAAFHPHIQRESGNENHNLRRYGDSHLVLRGNGLYRHRVDEDMQRP
jgi:hypothetical protein